MRGLSGTYEPPGTAACRVTGREVRVPAGAGGTAAGSGWSIALAACQPVLCALLHSSECSQHPYEAAATARDLSFIVGVQRKEGVTILEPGRDFNLGLTLQAASFSPRLPRA